MFYVVDALNVILAGGTGPVGQGVASKLGNHDVTILTRNAFLAATPNRVTEQFGWVGERFLSRFLHVRLRDWDGGDLLDIVGNQWIGWQDDTLAKADVVVHLVGGFTEQRVMACERLVRESLSVNRDALHITVCPSEKDLELISPGMPTMKKARVHKCEEMVKTNMPNSACLRLEANRLEQGCDGIVKEIESWKKN
jgi:hypothetical protein